MHAISTLAVNVTLDSVTTNYDNFVVTDSERGVGYGAVTTSGSYSNADVTFGVSSTYRLPTDTSPFIRVTTTITNLGTGVASNARLWVMLWDDQLGADTVVHMKAHGSSDLSRGFVLANFLTSHSSNTAVAASHDYGVFLLSTTPGASAFISATPYGISQNVAAAPGYLEDNDGSLGIYFRLPNLQPGGSQQVSWVLGANDRDNLESTISAALRPDSVEPRSPPKGLLPVIFVLIPLGTFVLILAMFFCGGPQSSPKPPLIQIHID